MKLSNYCIAAGHYAVGEFTLTEVEIRIIRGAIIKAVVECMYPDDSDRLRHYEEALTLTNRLLKQLK